jgi:hypothetical protein
MALQSQNLDSLLDTMTNVVGILLVMMIVTLISSGEAVQRIRTLEATGMTPQALGELTAQAEALGDELAALRASAAALPAAELDADEAFALRDTRAAALARLEAEVAAARGELSRVRIALRDAPPAETRAPREVRLPDPRPAPPGSKPLMVFCRFGRLLVVDYDRLTGQLEAGIQTAVGRPSGYVRLDSRDHAWIVNHFQSRAIGNRWLRWVLVDRGPRQLVARLEWLDRTAGETPEQMRRMDSVWRRALRDHDPRSRTLRFYVWSDSFESYLEARAAAEARGFAAWWEALDPAEEFEGNVYQAASAPRALVD